MNLAFRSTGIATLLVLSAAAGAQAQSTVSVSGKLQLSYARGNSGTSPLYGGGAFNGSTINSETSQLNVAGKEDLGDGLYASFDLQHFFMADTGVPAYFASKAFWDGRSIVRFGKAGVGEVYLGHDYAPLAHTGFSADPWGWDGSAMQVGGLQWANYATTNGIRTSNTLGFKTASFAGGFVGQLAFSAGEGTAGRGAGGSVTFTNEPFWAAIAYDEHANVGGKKDHLWMIAAAYDLGVIRPVLYVSQSSVAGVTYNGAGIAVTAPAGTGILKAAIARLDDGETAIAGKQNVMKFSIAYEYPFSKRTAAFGGFATSKMDGLGRTSVGEVGLRHNF